jgi:hypothetical protein
MNHKTAALLDQSNAKQIYPKVGDGCEVFLLRNDRTRSPDSCCGGTGSSNFGKAPYFQIRVNEPLHSQTKDPGEFSWIFYFSSSIVFQLIVSP